MPHSADMHTVAETPIFSRRADALLSEDERKALIDALAFEPLAGAVIPGTGGVRKLRFAAQGQGKSSAVRVIYYVVSDDAPIYALLIYGKAERVDMTPDQKRTVAKLAADLKASVKARTGRRMAG